MDEGDIADNEAGYSDDEGISIDGIYIPAPLSDELLLPANNNTRLIITKITNRFFKSYAEETILGPFHKCFNAIVGPNGSGKSNVIDSMLFVFGYRASKIRSKKLSVLIHNSEKYRNVQSCTVAVHFAEIYDDDSDAYNIVPNTEFVVSRTAKKDNSSYYEINGRQVQFKEVSRRLKNYGIDLQHNRFLILQGEVEQIAMMKCKATNEHETGFLEYLEEIIGTVRYKKPLDQLSEKVDILSDERLEKLSRLNLVQKEMQELEGPVKEAVNFLKSENTLFTNKHMLYQKKIFDLEIKLKDTQEKNSDIENNHKELITKLETLANEKKEKNDKLKQQSSKYSKLEKQLNDFKQDFENADKKDVQLQSDMVATNQTRKKKKELLAQERKNLIEYQQAPEKYEAEVAECEARKNELIEKKNKLEEEKNQVLASVQNDAQELKDQKEECVQELTKYNKVVGEAKAAFCSAEAELKFFLQDEENNRKFYDELKETFERNTTSMSTYKIELDKLKNELPLLEKRYNNAVQEIKTIRVEESNLNREIPLKRDRLEEFRSSMQASKSRNKVLDFLMQKKREGQCPGLYGRLGDLGAIDLKYDIAISTACGPLDDIVVDTVATAEWCINSLKKNNVGRVTFIALEKQEYLHELANTRIQTPENVPRLYDLIRVNDEMYKTAFYYALRNTLVANDLDQGCRVAYGSKRYRVVTLNGDLIEMSGTMSGGGKSVCRGRMGQSVIQENFNPNDIQKLQTNIEQLENRVRSIRQRIIELEREIDTVQIDLRQKKHNYEEIQLKMKQLQNNQPQLEKRLSVQKQKMKTTKTDPIKLKQLQMIVNEKQKKYEFVQNNAEKIQQKITDLTNQIKAKTTDKVSVVSKKLNEVENVLNKCKKEITRLHVAVTTANKNMKTSEEKIATYEQDIATLENKLRSMQTERQEIEIDARKISECIAETRNKLDEYEIDFNDMKKDVANITKQENLLKSEKVDLDELVKQARKKLDDITGTLHQYHKKKDEIKLHEIINETVEPLKEYTKNELDEKDFKEIENDIQQLETQLKKANPNLNALADYQRILHIYVNRSKELQQVTDKRNELKKIFEEVKNRRKEEFLKGYAVIRLKLKEMYQMITLGGDADFEIVDSFDPFSEGIQFNVRPAKKTWKVVSNLSGGEKTLSSLALVFALHYYKPSPLYVMDEIDAALDFRNVSIVAHYIKERTKNAQFIIISLRSNMFELCDNLIGIYKISNCTQTIAIDPRSYDNNEVNHDEENVINKVPLNNEIIIEKNISHVNLSNEECTINSTELNDSSSATIPSRDIIDDSFIENMDVDLN